MTQEVASEILRLAASRLELGLAPGLGGSIAWLRWQQESGNWIDLLRPANAETLRRGGVEAMGCFPLIPFSNRLRAGKFKFQGRQITLPRNTAGPHVEHGHGWQRRWQAIEAGTDRAILRLDHEPDAWPFAYLAEQRFRLRADGLEIELYARNTDRLPMPFGFGLHPYFPRTPKSRLTAAVSGFWETDGEAMPTRLLAPPPNACDPTTGLTVSQVALDNVFTGWNGHARIEWPERAAQLAVSAPPPLRFLVVYTPPGEDYFCAEPVSHCTDAFNLAAKRTDTGMMILQPGQTAAARLLLAPSALAG